MRATRYAGEGQHAHRREAVLVCSGMKDGAVFDRVLYALTRDIGMPYVPYAAPDPPGA